jgi:type IV pilus assembly protein PilA
LVRRRQRARREAHGGQEIGMHSAIKSGRRFRGGFTLVELLAVIAIIGILAAIVVPRVTRFIARARVARAVSEIKNAETAITGVLTETGRSNFRDFLNDAARQKLDDADALINAGNFQGVLDAQSFYQNFFYELLRQGKESQFIIDNVLAEVRQKIGTTAIPIGTDPWGQQYNFWMGPLRGPVPLRSYRLASTTYNPSAVLPDDPAFNSASAYVYNADAKDYAQRQVPGQPAADDLSIHIGYQSMFPNILAYGFPAPRDVEVYMWSSGPNQRNDANLLVQLNQGVDQSDPAFLGGGDDPNSWDNENGWENAPKV